MIRLLVFAAWENAIVSKENTSSLIGLIENFNINKPSNSELQPHAAFPIRWFAFGLWTKIGNIPNPIEYEQRIELVSPNGEIYMGGHAVFLVNTEDHLNIRTVLEFPAFPIGLEGIYKLTMRYKQTDAEEWEQAGEYPIRVIHHLIEVENANEIKIETNNQSNQFEKFKEFARKIVNVPKKEIDEQEKIYQAQKEKEKEG